MKPSDAIWLNHSCGERSTMLMSFQTIAAIGLSVGGTPDFIAVTRLPAAARLHPSTKPADTTASPIGQATNVTIAIRPSHAIAWPASPAPEYASSWPIHVLGSHDGALGRCSELMSPSMCAKRAKLSSQNPVGTAAPITHSISLATRGGMTRSATMVMVAKPAYKMAGKNARPAIAAA